MRVYQILNTCALLIVILIGCSNNDNSQEPNNEPQVGVIDPALVGTWSGSLNGSFGAADMTMELSADGGLSAEGSTALYCPIAAKWEVIGGRFKAKGNDDCDGTSVTFDAAYSTTKLVGTWNASSGNNGTFTAEKQ